MSAERIAGFVDVPPCPCAKDCGHAAGMHWLRLPDGDGGNGEIHCTACELDDARAALREARERALEEIDRDVLASILLREFSSASAETWENTRETRRDGFRRKADSIIRALAERPPAERGDAGCHDCGMPYKDFPLDATLPHEDWALISPSGDENGLLCARCMVARIKRLIPGVVAVRMTADRGPSR